MGEVAATDDDRHFAWIWGFATARFASKSATAAATFRCHSLLGVVASMRTDVGWVEMTVLDGRRRFAKPCCRIDVGLVLVAMWDICFRWSRKKEGICILVGNKRAFEEGGRVLCLCRDLFHCSVVSNIHEDEVLSLVTHLFIGELVTYRTFV